MADRVIVDSESLPWIRGEDVLASFEPAFRSGLGPADAVLAAYSSFRQKRLFQDPVTTRRIDIISLAPGYADATFSYHSSAEESIKLGPGEVDLRGSEGVLQTGDYFWRPPGWVHGCVRSTGVSSLVILAGIEPYGGPVDRHVRPSAEAGTNAIHADLDAALGPRGWVKNVRTRFMPWQPGRSFARTEGRLQGFDINRTGFKVLSKSWLPAGGQTLLLRLEPGYRQAGPGRHSSVTQTYVMAGSFRMGENVLSKGFFFHRPANSVEEPMESPKGAVLFMKVDGPLNFLLAR